MREYRERQVNSHSTEGKALPAVERGGVSGGYRKQQALERVAIVYNIVPVNEQFRLSQPEKWIVGHRSIER